ncbi:MAG: LacI family transcriptional regulator [Bacteroidales bacterium]|nr:LacI family transcriptional regulator [Bacteroidales bacterium]
MKNSKEITIYDVAKALNISPSTVSRGLKNHPHVKKETRDKIKTAAREMGYRRNKFASNLRKKSTETIGVVVPRLNSYFMAAAIAGMEKVTNQLGYGLIISQSQESASQEVSCVSTLFNSRVDGLLISLAYDTDNFDYFNTLSNKGIPVVFFDRVAECNDCMNIVIDNFRAGYEITKHLIEQGCRRIMHLGGNFLRNVYYDRFMGYRLALDEAGLEFEEIMLVINELNSQSGMDVARGILEMKSRPDGIFVANDTTAVAVICELQREGVRIPEDIAVAGFNNEPISQVIKPNLTTIDYPAREIGEVAATSLINKLKNTENIGFSRVVLRHRLVIRESSLKKG